MCPGIPVRGHDNASVDVVDAQLSGDGRLAAVEDAVMSSGGSTRGAAGAQAPPTAGKPMEPPLSLS